MTRLVLASTSPARLSLLRSGGIEPTTIAPGVDEDLVADRAVSMGLIENTADMVHILAKAKAEAVIEHPDARNAVIIGCDSSLEFNGESLGKPHEPHIARERWLAMRGNSGTLFSGHWVIDNRQPQPGRLAPAAGRVSASVVHFADITDAEIDAKF